MSTGLRLGFALCLGLGLLATTPGAGRANVVVNGGFDDTTSGWTGTWALRDTDPVIDTGTYFFSGASAFNSINQSYDLSDSERADLADKGLRFVLSADLFGWHGQRDFSTLRVDFLDSSLTSLAATELTSTTNDPGSWPTLLFAGAAPNFQTASGLVPAGTASLLFTISAQRIDGSNNDGYIDNVALGLSVVPLPAALPLMAAATGVLTFLGLRRRRA